MKTKILFLIPFIVFFAHTTYAQKDTLFVQDIFVDPSTNLVYEAIIQVDSTSREVLINRFENWGGQSFTNYNEVKTGKTNDQITLRYISSAYFSDMYVGLIAEFKENKVRLRFYDEGNAYIPSSYSGGVLVPPRPQGSYHLIDSFDKDGTLIYKVKQSEFNNKEATVRALKKYRKQIRTSVEAITTFLKNPNPTPNEKDDW